MKYSMIDSIVEGVLRQHEQEIVNHVRTMTNGCEPDQFNQFGSTRLNEVEVTDETGDIIYKFGLYGVEENASLSGYDDNGKIHHAGPHARHLGGGKPFNSVGQRSFFAPGFSVYEDEDGNRHVVRDRDGKELAVPLYAYKMVRKFAETFAEENQ